MYCNPKRNQSRLNLLIADSQAWNDESIELDSQLNPHFRSQNLPRRQHRGPLAILTRQLMAWSKRKMRDRLMSASEVIGLIGCGRSTFYKWIRAGRFPSGVKINGLRKWWESIVLDFLRGGVHPVTIPPATPTPTSSAPATPTFKRKRLAKHVKPKEHRK